MQGKYDMITVLGHTAASKTSVAAHIASVVKGEVISADSRQVYRGMDIGTGKDYSDYFVEGKQIPAHMLDIVDAGYEYSVFEFQKDFIKVYNRLRESGLFPVLCGGSGLYLESVLRQYELIRAPIDEDFRKDTESLDLDELVFMLSKYKALHNTTDTTNRKRVIRAIEIARYQMEHQESGTRVPEIRSLNIGIKYDRDDRRNRISNRLKQRLDQGMIDEVKLLLKNGIAHEQLEYYGLEYKYLSRYLNGSLTYDEMYLQLNTAIHQFAKRQMTYFRGMEKRGVKIHWIAGNTPLSEKLSIVMQLMDSI